MKTQQLQVFSPSPKLLAVLDLSRDDWRAPAVSDQGREAARAALAQLEPSLRPADRTLVEGWLGSLGVLTAGGRMTADDAKAKCRAYAAMLDYPVGCFTKETLGGVARFMTFFPSFAELCGELDKALRRLERMRRRLEVMAAEKAHYPPPPQPPRSRLSAGCAKQLGALIAKLESECKPVFSPSQRKPSEGSKEPITTIRGYPMPSDEKFSEQASENVREAMP